MTLRAILGLMLMLGGDTIADGRRAYEQARFKDAVKAFSEAEQLAGHSAPPELLYDEALAALRAGDLRLAESCAEKAGARGGPTYFGLRDFLLGNAAFRRCELAQTLAERPEAGPIELDQAISHAEAALGFWQEAASSREDWPPARRNVERALLKLDELKKKREEAQKKRRRPPPPPPPPKPRKDEKKEVERERKIDPQLQELSPEEIRLLLERLGKKQKEKIEVRRAWRKSGKARVERDW